MYTHPPSLLDSPFKQAGANGSLLSAIYEKALATVAAAVREVLFDISLRCVDSFRISRRE